METKAQTNSSPVDGKTTVQVSLKNWQELTRIKQLNGNCTYDFIIENLLSAVGATKLNK